MAAIAAIAAVAAGLRLFQLGRLSFWYDEVVTMRLARAGNPGALIKRLFEIDATRAPLHPLLLEVWTRVFGPSEAAARGFSVLCGMVTILLIFGIARAAFDTPTGLWAAWLAALSPALIVYAREARMYAWLVLVTCLSWWLLLVLRRSPEKGPDRGSGTVSSRITWGLRPSGSTPATPVLAFGTQEVRDEEYAHGSGLQTPPIHRPRLSWLLVAAAYVVSLTALIYSHPLGLLMAGTLALAGLIGFGSWRRWLAVHLAVATVTVPWVGHYLDHPPEFLSDPPSLRFLLGTPIGFIGGDSRVLLGLTILIAWGIAGRVVARDDRGRWRIVPGSAIAPVFLLLWLSLPPLALYVYSRVAHPIFGPARYTLFVAPAYLILVAMGLSRLPAVLRYPLAMALTILAASELGPKVYDPALKADWRGFSAAIAAPGTSALVIVATSNPDRNVEVETARYYLPTRCEAIALKDATTDRLAQTNAGAVYLAIGLRRGVPAVAVPERVGPYRFRAVRSYPGLMVYRAED
ncbi:MAG: glycosyltransferase family 39 protein [Isosphaeraceae bacterium]